MKVLIGLLALFLMAPSTVDASTHRSGVGSVQTHERGLRHAQGRARHHKRRHHHRKSRHHKGHKRHRASSEL